MRIALLLYLFIQIDKVAAKSAMRHNKRAEGGDAYADGLLAFKNKERRTNDYEYRSICRTDQ